jgi:hypothetical protein
MKMMKPHEKKLVITGISTLSIGAVLGIAAVLLGGRMPSVSQTLQWAEVVSSKKYIISYFLLIYAYLIPIVGFWGIHKLFGSDRRSYLLSFWGMILAILGSALPMASIGVAAFASPATARMFFSHGIDVVTLTKDVFTSNVMIYMLLAGVYYLAGITLLGIVIWRNGDRRLRIASISLIAHGVLIILPEQVFVNLSSWILLLISGISLLVHARSCLKE